MRPVIFGLAGLQLTNEERTFFKQVEPVGFILFARNVDTPQQVKALVADLKELAGGECLILIDQEGGRVARLRPPHFAPTLPVAKLTTDPQKASDLVIAHSRLIAAECQALGINCSCYPVLDVPVDGADPIIGDRAFSTDPKKVAEYGALAIDTFLEAGILPVIKHIPGHGRGDVDSHLHLPRVNATSTELEADFFPFKAARNAPLAMTAHIAYDAYDATDPATFSNTVIDHVVRGEIGFNGLLMTDDLSMQALEGDMASRATRALDGGCDILLHCNGNMEEMVTVFRSISTINSNLTEKIEVLLSLTRECIPLDLQQIRDDYAEATAHLWETSA